MIGSRICRAALATTLLCTCIGTHGASAQVAPWTTLPDGALDPRFGDNGIVLRHNVSSPNDVTIQPDGKILAATGTGVVSRHNVDGSLDDTFGNHGVITAAGPLLLQPDGKILAGAWSITRYNPDGSIDRSFGTEGRIEGLSRLMSLSAVDSSGRIVLATAGGWTSTAPSSTIEVHRYDSGGRRDPSFGSGGVIRWGNGDVLNIGDLEVTPEGKVVIAGEGFQSRIGVGNQQFFLARFNVNGTIDTGFGAGGFVYTDFSGFGDTAQALVIQPDGKIVAAGRAGAQATDNRLDFALARYLEDGSLDGTFGVGGRVVTTFSTRLADGWIRPFATINDIALRPDGRIITTGGTNGPPDIAMAQYTSAGVLDTTFGDGGTLLTDISGRNEYAVGIDLQPDGQAVVVSESFDATTYAAGTALTRYRSDSARGGFAGSARAIPGQIEAEDYDLGGPGIGYVDTTPGNEQGFFRYRTDDVDVKESVEGGHAVGWLAAGEWLAYTTDVPHDGLYTLSARVGSAFPDRSFHIEVDGTDVTGRIAVPQVADWDQYQTVAVPDVYLTAGRRVVRVVMGPEDFMDFQWLAFAQQTTAPFGGAPSPVPGRLEAEHYDIGGPGLAYADSTPGNEQGFPVFRTDDVDIKASAEGGYAIGWFAAGEWLAYTVNVQSAGVYTLQARVGSAFPGRTFHVEVDGTDVTGPIAVPQLPDWDQYDTVTVPGVNLPGGEHVLRVVMGPQDFMDFQSLELFAAQP